MVRPFLAGWSTSTVTYACAKPKRRTHGDTTPTPPDPSATQLPPVHPALAGVLSELPPRGSGWTQERREEFMKTFQAVVDFTIPIQEEEPDDEEEFEEDADELQQ